MSKNSINNIELNYMGKEKYLKLLLWEIINVQKYYIWNSELLYQIGEEYNSKGLKIQHSNGINSWKSQTYDYNPQNEIRITMLDRLVSALFLQYFRVYIINKRVEYRKLRDLLWVMISQPIFKHSNDALRIIIFIYSPHFEIKGNTENNKVNKGINNQPNSPSIKSNIEIEKGENVSQNKPEYSLEEVRNKNSLSYIVSTISQLQSLLNKSNNYNRSFSKILSLIYKKEVTIDCIRLRRMFLDSQILSESLCKIIIDNKKSLVGKLKVDIMLRIKITRDRLLLRGYILRKSKLRSLKLSNIESIITTNILKLNNLIGWENVDTGQRQLSWNENLSILDINQNLEKKSVLRSLLSNRYLVGCGIKVHGRVGVNRTNRTQHDSLMKGTLKNIITSNGNVKNYYNLNYKRSNVSKGSKSNWNKHGSYVVACEIASV